jgi:hypothetical protein
MPFEQQKQLVQQQLCKQLRGIAGSIHACLQQVRCGVATRSGFDYARGDIGQC